MINLDRGTVLSFMREALYDFYNRPGDPYFSTLLSMTLKKLLEAGLVDPRVVGKADFNQLTSSCNFEEKKPTELVEVLTVLTEGYQHLLSFGYIIPRPGSISLSYDRFAVTKVGQQWIARAEPIPEDRAGYLAALLKLVPNLDPITKQYAEEALMTYERRAFFASAVMIGAASESLMYQMMNALLKAVQGTPEEKNVQKAINGRSLSTMFDTLKRNIHRAKSRPSGAMNLDRKSVV